MVRERRYQSRLQLRAAEAVVPVELTDGGASRVAIRATVGRVCGRNMLLPGGRRQEKVCAV